MLSLLSFILTGCKDNDNLVETNDPVRVELAYAFSSSSARSQTRQADAVVQNTNNRVPNPFGLRIIGTYFDGSSHELRSSEVAMENTIIDRSDEPQSRFYHSRYCSLTAGVNRCLVYGTVENESSGGVDPKVYNGCISSNIPTDITGLNSISFTLESIRESATAPEEASTVAGYLTAVTNAKTDGGLYWKTSENVILKNLFTNFTNHGEDLPGSAATVKQWLLALATAAQGYYANPPSAIGEEERMILLAIKNAAKNQAEAMGTISDDDDSYPRNLHLPDGAAALRWVDTANEFQPAMQTTTLDNINAVSRFAYPASLYYFVDSPIKTSESTVDFATLRDDGDIDVPSGKTVWETLLAKDDLGLTGNSVSSSTKTVAIEKPVQYAVAQLQVKIQARPTEENGSTFKDGSDKDITIGTENFPLKGIIVCGQRPVNYLFEQASNSDVNVKFIYDSQVKNCNLSSASMVDACKTLVLQSYAGEDVEIILEFENNSGTAFEGVDGTIYPDTRFYLIGKVEAGNYLDSNVNDENKKQVFTKDYTTTVEMTVSSLAKAYNVLPNLLTSNMEIGVETSPQWIAATPTAIRLD